MKKIYSLFLLLSIAFATKAASYTVTISGFSYSPATLTVNIGDVVTINASGGHPLAEVDQTTWNANGTATLSTGFGVKTANHTFTVTSNNTMYYVCTAHVTMGMKGQIVVNSVGVNEQQISFNNVNVFPNPAANKVQIAFSSIGNNNVSVALFDITGRKIENIQSNFEAVNGTNVITYHIPHYLNSGNYFIEISAGNQKTSRKLIIVE